MMRKNMKLLLIPCTAAALTLGSAMISFAATGWAEENGQWVYSVSYTHLTLPTKA